MDSAQRSHLTEVDWLATSPFGPYAAAFKRHLSKCRYAAHTIASYLAEITHFARWACTRRVPLARIDEVSVAIFLDDHLPGCACTGPVRHDRGDHSAALGHLLLVLRAQGAIAHPPVSTVPVDEELRRYDEHMDHVRGLAPRTRSSALRIVGRLADRALRRCRHRHRRDQARARAALLRRNRPSSTASRPAPAAVVASLRGYFRYRASLGDLVHGLIGAVSYPANWQLSSLPKTLTAEEVEQLVGSLGKPGRSHAARRRHRALRPRSRSSQRRGCPAQPG